MANPVEKKIEKKSFVAWLSDGQATYQGYGFLAASLNFSDTAPRGVINDGKLLMPLTSETLLDVNNSSDPSPGKKYTLIALKSIDIFVQVITGSFIFGMIQEAGERIRKTNPATGLVLGTIGRVGLFSTQIITGAIRLPLAIISGTVGALVGAYSALTASTTDKKWQLFFARVGEAVWPFAPTAGSIIAYYLPLQESQTGSPSVSRINTAAVIGIAATVIAITLVALVATGTMGAGLVALPFVAKIASSITLGAKVLLATMFAGGLSSMFSNIIHAVKDNGKAVKDNVTVMLEKFKNKNGQNEPLLVGGDRVSNLSLRSESASSTSSTSNTTDSSQGHYRPVAVAIAPKSNAGSSVATQDKKSNNSLTP